MLNKISELQILTISSNTVTSSSSSDRSIDERGGAGVAKSYIDNIGTLERVLDTYIGGDNNNDGYYYDYDTNGEIAIYKLSEQPLNITMSGEGTEQKPYIINNADLGN